MLEMLGILFGSLLAVVGCVVFYYIIIRLIVVLSSDKLWDE